MAKTVSDSSHCAYGEGLYQETLSLRDRCLSELTARYNVPKEITSDKLRELLHAEIIHQYKRSVGAGKMWPTLNHHVLNALVKAHGIPTRR